jgi:hypothetical protein
MEPELVTGGPPLTHSIDAIAQRCGKGCVDLRGLTPAGFVLVALCFLLPFAAVPCDAPGGFSRAAAPGGTTTCTGVDLAVGGAPTVTADRVRAPDQQREDRLPPQVLALAVLGLALAGATLTAVHDARLRRRGVLLVAAVAGLAHLANQYRVEALLAAGCATS